MPIVVSVIPSLSLHPQAVCGRAYHAGEVDEFGAVDHCTQEDLVANGVVEEDMRIAKRGGDGGRLVARRGAALSDLDAQVLELLGDVGGGGGVIGGGRHLDGCDEVVWVLLK